MHKLKSNETYQSIFLEKKTFMALLLGTKLNTNFSKLCEKNRKSWQWEASWFCVTKLWCLMSSFFWGTFFLCIAQNVLEYFCKFCNMTSSRCNTVYYKKCRDFSGGSALSCRLVDIELWTIQKVSDFSLQLIYYRQINE